MADLPERIWVDEDTWFDRPAYSRAVEYVRAEAIAALPAQGVRVKPLVWESIGNGQVADDLYTIGVNHSEHEGRFWLIFGGTVLATADDVDYLKDTATWHWEARIRAALAAAEAGAVEAQNWHAVSDWSGLPDVYVTKVEKLDGMFWRVEACSVPMAIGPEVRLSVAPAPDARKCPYGATGDACCGGYCNMAGADDPADPRDAQPGKEVMPSEQADDPANARSARSPGVTAGAVEALVKAAGEWKDARDALNTFETENPGNTTKRWVNLMRDAERTEEAFWAALAAIREGRG